MLTISEYIRINTGRADDFGIKGYHIAKKVNDKVKNIIPWTKSKG